jgi:hypothetical protein
MQLVVCKKVVHDRVEPSIPWAGISVNLGEATVPLRLWYGWATMARLGGSRMLRPPMAGAMDELGMTGVVVAEGGGSPPLPDGPL